MCILNCLFLFAVWGERPLCKQGIYISLHAFCHQTRIHFKNNIFYLNFSVQNQKQIF